MRRRSVEFFFKGGRQYITGADMFNAIVGAHPQHLVRNIDLTIHSLVRTAACDLYEADLPDDLTHLQGIKVRASFELGGNRRFLALKESGSSTVSRRCAYPEDHITSLCHIQDRDIVLDGQSPFSFIETVVAMNKHLHQKLFVDAMGQWMFTGIHLVHGCDSRERLTLRIGSEVNYRLTRANIRSASRPIGDLFFSLLKS